MTVSETRSGTRRASIRSRRFILGWNIPVILDWNIQTIYPRVTECYADVMDAPQVHHKVTSRSYDIHG